MFISATRVYTVRNIYIITTVQYLLLPAELYTMPTILWMLQSDSRRICNDAEVSSVLCVRGSCDHTLGLAPAPFREWPCHLRIAWCNDNNHHNMRTNVLCFKTVVLDT